MGKPDASMDLRVIVCKKVVDWAINRSATGKVFLVLLGEM